MTSVKRALTLAHLSFLDKRPADLLRIAAHAGFDAVSLRLATPAAGHVCYPLQAGSDDLRELRRLADGLGVEIAEVEVVCLAADTEVAQYLPLLEAGAELGATRLCVNVDDPVRSRAVENGVQLCDLAAPLGMAVDIEFMVWRPVHDLRDAAGFVKAVARPNAFVLVDALHLQRCGAIPGQIDSALLPLIGNVQLCDAPLRRPADDQIVAEARGDRLLPGEGELPLAELVARLPAGLSIGVEIPTRRYAQGMDCLLYTSPSPRDS